MPRVLVVKGRIILLTGDDDDIEEKGEEEDSGDFNSGQLNKSFACRWIYLCCFVL